MTQDMTPRSPGSATATTQRLEALRGRWRTDGYLTAHPRTRITGWDSYAWLPGRAFLVHHVDVVVGDRAVRALEVIGQNPSGVDTFTAQAFDDTGDITVMLAAVDQDGVWTFTGGPDVAPAARRTDETDEDGSTRSTLVVAADRMHAAWERRAADGKWQPWMDVTFTREGEATWTDLPTADGPADTVPEPLRRLDALAGSWRWAGESRTGPFTVTGSTTLSWLAGGQFLVEHGALTSDGQTAHSLAVTGWDETSGACVAHYFDQSGSRDTYRTDVVDDEVTIRWARYRFAGRLDTGGERLTGTWEQSSDGSRWDYWYDAELTRVQG